MESGKNQQAIILVDDDQEDRQLFTEAAAEAGIAVRMQCIEDGDQLSELLFPSDPAAVKIQPVLIFLDLNLPAGGGKKSLEALKRSEAYKRIPVVVFTTSAVKEEITWAYSTGANSLIMKPFSYHDLVDIMRLIKAYWFETVELP